MKSVDAVNYEDMVQPLGTHWQKEVEEEGGSWLREHLSPLFQSGQWLLPLWASGPTVHRSLSQGDLGSECRSPSAFLSEPLVRMEMR